VIPGISDADSVLNLGSGVLAAARMANAPRDWPNVHESLVELYAILDEWCDTGEASNLEIRRQIMKRRRALANPGMSEAIVIGGHFTQDNYFVGAMELDSKDLLRPDAPWFQRWSSSKRRSAARRSLASILAVYAPELIKSFDEAISERAGWVKRRDEELKRWLSDTHSIDDEESLLEEMEISLTKLRVVRGSLADFINKNFPLGMPGKNT
jgi:hypothetical protein